MNFYDGVITKLKFFSMYISKYSHGQIIWNNVFFLQYWLDVDKQLNHQVGLSNHEPLLKFCVKFYTPDPSMIEEEYTRYLFGLEIKRDLATSQLQCNDNTAALMASYIVQGKPHKLHLFLHPKGYPMGWSKGNWTLSWNHCGKIKEKLKKCFSTLSLMGKF